MATKSKKRYFKSKGQSQGHKIMDLGVIWKGIDAKYEVFIFYSLKIVAKVKVNWQQTDRTKTIYFRSTKF